MYNEINATFKVTINPINPNAKSLKFVEYVQIPSSDRYLLQDMLNDFAQKVLDEDLEDRIWDVMEDYSISQEEYDKLPSREKVKLEEFGVEEKRYVLKPEVEFEEELEQYPQTLSEYYADIGMSERDF